MSATCNFSLITSDHVSFFNESAFMVMAKKNFYFKIIKQCEWKKVPLAYIESDWCANLVVICKMS